MQHKRGGRGQVQKGGGQGEEAQLLCLFASWAGGWLEKETARIEAVREKNVQLKGSQKDRQHKRIVVLDKGEKTRECNSSSMQILRILQND